jgi:CheY-like chemotaxis protein
MDQKYILVVQDDELFRNLTVAAIESMSQLKIEQTINAPDAIRRVSERGAPELVISFYQMQGGNADALADHLAQHMPAVPLLIISDRKKEEIMDRVPKAVGIYEKKNAFSAIRGFFQRQARIQRGSKSYIPIKLSVLAEMNLLATDVYLKLGDTNYVRYLQKDEMFMPEDGKKLIEKRVMHLHVAADDADAFFGGFQDLLDASAKKLAASPEDLVVMGADFLDTTQKLADTFGWTPEVVAAAQKCIAVAIKAVTANPSIQKLLEARVTSGGSKAKELVTLTSLLACTISQKLEWASDLTQVKLSMAALLHDITLDEYTCEHMGEWNLRADRKEDKSSEIETYRNHPRAAAEKVRGIADLPPDIDQIVLQHHERPDGTGFPQGLQASRISPLSAVLIFAEDLALHLIDATDRKAAIREFAEKAGERYNAGVFRKVYQAFAEDVAGAG